MKKIECSKKIILASYIIAIILTIIIIICTFLQIDVSNLTTITSIVYGEVTVSNAFYFRKSAKENVPKILGGLPKELWEQIDINQLLNE